MCTARNEREEAFIEKWVLYKNQVEKGRNQKESQGKRLLLYFLFFF